MSWCFSEFSAMKVQQFILLTTFVVVSGTASAQQSSRVEQSTSKTDIERVTIRTTAASGGLSLMPLRLNAAVGGADVLIGNITACDGGVVNNAHTDVRLRDLTIRSTGSAKIGNISAGC